MPTSLKWGLDNTDRTWVMYTTIHRANINSGRIGYISKVYTGSGKMKALHLTLGEPMRDNIIMSINRK